MRPYISKDLAVRSGNQTYGVIKASRAQRVRARLDSVHNLLYWDHKGVSIGQCNGRGRVVKRRAGDEAGLGSN